MSPTAFTHIIHHHVVWIRHENENPLCSASGGHKGRPAVTQWIFVHTEGDFVFIRGFPLKTGCVFVNEYMREELLYYCVWAKWCRKNTNFPQRCCRVLRI